jgi:hypothetical protein
VAWCWIKALREETVSRRAGSPEVLDASRLRPDRRPVPSAAAETAEEKGEVR